PASPVLDHLARDDLQALDQPLGAPPAVALDKADRYVRAARQAALPLAEHRVRLADPRRRAKVDPEPAGRLNHVAGVFAGRAHVLTGAHRHGDLCLLVDLGVPPLRFAPVVRRYSRARCVAAWVLLVIPARVLEIRLGTHPTGCPWTTMPLRLRRARGLGVSRSAGPGVRAGP